MVCGVAARDVRGASDRFDQIAQGAHHHLLAFALVCRHELYPFLERPPEIRLATREVGAAFVLRVGAARVSHRPPKQLLLWSRRAGRRPRLQATNVTARSIASRVTRAPHRSACLFFFPESETARTETITLLDQPDAMTAWADGSVSHDSISAKNSGSLHSRAIGSPSSRASSRPNRRSA